MFFPPSRQSIINQNHNTNYGFGGIIFNNNPVYLFQGGTVADHPAPDMKKQVCYAGYQQC